MGLSLGGVEGKPIVNLRGVAAVVALALERDGLTKAEAVERAQRYAALYFPSDLSSPAPTLLLPSGSASLAIRQAPGVRGVPCRHVSELAVEG